MKGGVILESHDYEVIVVGAGHAGCEAALAAARMGCKTLLITLSLDGIALMPCNPSIGGPAKAQLVREIDALGGEMGINIDKARIQIRMLNTGRGPAVQAMRAQADKEVYQKEMTRTLLAQENLELLEAEVERIEADSGQVEAVVTDSGDRYRTKALVLTTGTYLKGRIIIGDISYEGGPHPLPAATKLSENLRELGFAMGRHKTGTPPRVARESIDFTRTEEQPGDDRILNFSYMSPKKKKPQVSCWLTHSTPRTHEIVMQNIHRSPLYTGVIKGTGTRYCPSFEDKVVQFADKDSHQIFIEPEGLHTDEMYIQGMNTSLPEDVQLAVMHSIPGLENARVLKRGYAIEYDYVVPSQLRLTLETREIHGLFTAGQVNGTSGYEEAAAQGLIAGINAARQVKGQEPFILKRSEAFTGVMIDDLTTKGINEPYRLLTSRAEYRLLLRQDNADLRLTRMGYQLGLVKEDRFRRLQQKVEKMAEVRQEMEEYRIKPGHPEVEALLAERDQGRLRDAVTIWELLRRPEIGMDDLVQAGLVSEEVEEEIRSQLEIECKYEGYIKKQVEQVERFERMEAKRIPEGIDYDEVPGLSNESRVKLKEVRPESIGQASRTPGVSVADVNVLLIYLEKKRRSSEHERGFAEVQGTAAGRE